MVLVVVQNSMTALLMVDQALDLIIQDQHQMPHQQMVGVMLEVLLLVVVLVEVVEPVLLAAVLLVWLYWWTWWNWNTNSINIL